MEFPSIDEYGVLKWISLILSEMLLTLSSSLQQWQTLISSISSVPDNLASH